MVWQSRVHSNASRIRAVHKTRPDRTRAIQKEKKVILKDERVTWRPALPSAHLFFAIAPTSPPTFLSIPCPLISHTIVFSTKISTLAHPAVFFSCEKWLGYANLTWYKGLVCVRLSCIGLWIGSGLDGCGFWRWQIVGGGESSPIGGVNWRNLGEFGFFKFFPCVGEAVLFGRSVLPRCNEVGLGRLVLWIRFSVSNARGY